MPFFAVECILRANNIENSCSIFLTREIVGYFSLDITRVTSILIVLGRYCSIFRPYSYDVRKHRTGFATSVVVSSWFVTMLFCSLSIITSKYTLLIGYTGVVELSFVFLSIWVHLKILIHARKTQRQIVIERSRVDTNRSKNDSSYLSWNLPLLYTANDCQRFNCQFELLKISIDY